MESHRRLPLAAGLLLVISLASIALNYLLFQRGRQYYLQLNETRLDPLGLSYYDPVPDGQRLASADLPRVVFFGDSRAASWPPPDLGQFEFVNRGIGAQTSAQAVLRFDDHVQPLCPQVVVVQVGINDLKTIPLFPERKESIVANCEENIQGIVARSTDLGAVVVLTTIFPAGRVPPERRPFWSEDVALAIDEVNAYIRSLGGGQVVVFDAYSILADDSGSTDPAYSRDLLHLNRSGYERLNAELLPVLASLDLRTTQGGK